MSNSTWILIAFVLYFGGIVLVATRFRKSKNLSDYFLGGRTLNPWVGALSAQASDMSGWLLMGLPGAIYAFGTGRAWIAVGLILGTAINWIFVAKRLRRYTIVAGNAFTLPQYLENRFEDKSHAIKLSAAAFFAVFFTIYVASGFVAGGTFLPQIFDISYQTAVLTVAAIIVAYTLIGGFLAVSWIDSFQGILMLTAILFLPIIFLFSMGSWGDFTAGIPGGYFDLFSDGQGGRITAVSIISDMAWGLGYFGMPHILVRLMAIRSEKEVSKSAAIAIVWVVLALGAAVMTGLIGAAFLPELANRETVFIDMIYALFLAPGSVIAIPIIGGLFLCGIFGAIKSTADSQLLVASSAITGDLYAVANKKASDKTLLWFSRAAVLAVTLVALWIALDAYDPALGGPNRSTGVMVLVAMAWAGFGAAFGPLVLLSLFWKRTNKVGAVLGILSGGLTVIFWQYLPVIDGATLGAHTGLYSLVPGFALSFVMVILGSFIGKAPSAEMLKDFETASQPLAE